MMSGRVLSARLFVPMDLGVSSTQDIDVFTNLEALWTVLGFFESIGIFMEVSSCKHSQLTPCPALTISRERGVRLDLSNDQLLLRNHPGIHQGSPHWSKRHCYHPVNSKEFRTWDSPSTPGNEDFKSSVSGARVRVVEVVAETNKRVCFLLFYNGPDIFFNINDGLKFSIPLPILHCPHLPPIPVVRLLCPQFILYRVCIFILSGVTYLFLPDTSLGTHLILGL